MLTVFRSTKLRPWPLLAASLLLAFSACDAKDANPEADSAAEDAMQEEAAQAPSNRIDIPESVRNNLGITFATVEKRRLRSTLRVPGHFELGAEARQHYTTPWPGYVELAEGLSEYGAISEGQVLYTLDVPMFAEITAEIAAAQLDLANATLERPVLEAEVEHARAATNPALFEGQRAALDSLETPMLKHQEKLGAAIMVWQERLDELLDLAESGAARSDEIAAARAQVASLQAELAEAGEDHAKLAIDRAAIDAEELAAQRDLPLAKAKLAQLDARTTLAEAELAKALRRAAAKLRLTVADLTQENAEGVPYWQRLGPISVRAGSAGRVESFPLRDGAWVDQGAEVLEVFNPQALRFRAEVRQVELAPIIEHVNLNSITTDAGALQAMLVSPDLLPNADPIACELQTLPSGDPAMRTIHLLAYPETLPSWAQVGVRAELELGLAESDEPEVLVIPRDAVIRDGLKDVIFRRDPWEPNAVIKMEPIFGKREGDWIEIKTDVAEGDQVVVGGIYELKLASSSSGQAKGGHFHADGTWHEGEH